MNNISIKNIVLVVILSCIFSVKADILPAVSSTPSIEFRHFPDRLHAFVWRNWELVSLERMAGVVETSPGNINAMGRSMGLPAHITPPDNYQKLGYISIIRRNWHILPYEQLLTLLDWDAEKLAFTLREDDFLWIKLGSFKPFCKKLLYSPPDESVKKRCRQIKNIVMTQFRDEVTKPGKPRFDFLSDISIGNMQATSVKKTSEKEPIRFLYSYSGVFGDPLLNPEIDPYPDKLLDGLAGSGVNGVWLHVVLRQLAPSRYFPEFGKDHEIRIRNLNRMVNKAKKYGIKLYLYINEPRAMPESFFEGRQEIRGIKRGDHYTMCTSSVEVQNWLKESLSYVFRHVPDLGGVFTITASENLTSCYSHSRDAAGCPRCSKRSGPEVIAEVNKIIAAGVWEGNPDAAVIVWDWGWPDGTAAGWGNQDWAQQIIEKLPDNVYLMSVSEWGKPIQRGGVSSVVGEYSISSIGPGPRAQKHWGLAKNRGLKTLAKVQINCSWELSAVPFLPVMNTVAQHCDNLAKTDIDGTMLSWTVGGYPSPNLELVSRFQSGDVSNVDNVLKDLAVSRYGAEASEDILSAWLQFSEAFSEYPFHISYVYSGPTQYGPSNLLYPQPTGYHATMIGFPYDDVNGWRAVYPADVLAGQFEKMAAGWQKGLAFFEKGLAKVKNNRQKNNARKDLGIARAACLHFKSVANQVRFIQSRNTLLSGSSDETQKNVQMNTIKRLVEDEMVIAGELYVLTKHDPRIGFEASNQYYYLPLDLVEKVLNCQYILDTLFDQDSAISGK